MLQKPLLSHKNCYTLSNYISISVYYILQKKLLQQWTYFNQSILWQNSKTGAILLDTTKPFLCAHAFCDGQVLRLWRICSHIFHICESGWHQGHHYAQFWCGGWDILLDYMICHSVNMKIWSFHVLLVCVCLNYFWHWKLHCKHHKWKISVEDELPQHGFSNVQIEKTFLDTAHTGIVWFSHVLYWCAFWGHHFGQNSYHNVDI